MFKKVLFTLLGFFLMISHLQGELLSSEMGTIIVVYQTDPVGQRLDRIRFWLINGNNERTLYPKKDEFFFSSHTPNERTVVISHLPIGHYKIEFLIPNTDYYFEEVPPRELTVTPGDVIKIEQAIRSTLPPPPPEEDVSKEIALVTINQPNPFFPYAPYPYRYPYPYSIPGSSPVPISLAKLSVIANQNVRWRLLLRGRIITSGVGSASDLPIPPARNYDFSAEEIPGYTFYITPQPPFDIAPGQLMRIELFYQREVGYLNVYGHVPSTLSTLTLSLYSANEDQSPIQVELTPINGEVSWESGPMQAGEYLLSFKSPDITLPIPEQRIVIQRGQIQKIEIPVISHHGALQVTTDSSQAVFTLATSTGEMVAQGKGFNHTFKNLKRGTYILNFKNEDPSLMPLVPSQQIFVPPEGASTKISYRKQGILKILSSEGINIILQSSENQKMSKSIQANEPQTFYLPEGHYQLTYEEVSSEKPPKTLDVLIRFDQPKTLSLGFERETLNQHPPKPKKIEKTLPEFNPEVYVEVPEGMAIVGDPEKKELTNERPSQEVFIPQFEIGVYEVTNAQFAQWLNRAIESKKITVDTQKPGHLLDLNGKLVCKTLEANSLSQLSLLLTENAFSVIPLPGKQNYPVIEVTWQGAMAYCQDKGFRLPTENEWEKAAGMSLKEKKRYLYGFSRDTIDRTWANYRQQASRSDAPQVLTTPVGFYDGIHTLPLLPTDQSLLKTNDAKSPVGAYDMSGNVWEWVSSGGEDALGVSYKIAKGGCYDSLAEGVRIAERIKLAPEHSDIYTGFRVVK